MFFLLIDQFYEEFYPNKIQLFFNDLDSSSIMIINKLPKTKHFIIFEKEYVINKKFI
jgi:hypothetical protein